MYGESCGAICARAELINYCKFYYDIKLISLFSFLFFHLVTNDYAPIVNSDRRRRNLKAIPRARIAMIEYIVDMLIDRVATESLSGITDHY